MGDVDQATNTKLRRSVAIKFLPAEPSRRGPPEDKARLNLARGVL